MKEVTYTKKNNEIECVHYQSSKKEFGPHTHANHLMVGYVESGRVCISIDGDSDIYEQGDEFKIEPNVIHEIKTVEDDAYSMMVLCIETETEVDDEYLKDLQNTILDNPENLYLIEQMAKDSQISPYHMIRRFKKAFGMTPHQFQIQSKVRKAQKLLEQNKSISEVAYESGFYDQSHLDRCFQKIVGMTPKEYQKTIENN